MKNVEAFFLELDGQWRVSGKGKIRLPIIGSSSLFLQTNYARGTKDSDVLETEDIPKYIANLHVVERDFFHVSETPIDLPEWMEEP